MTLTHSVLPPRSLSVSPAGEQKTDETRRVSSRHLLLVRVSLSVYTGGRCPVMTGRMKVPLVVQPQMFVLCVVRFEEQEFKVEEEKWRDSFSSFSCDLT